MVWRRAASHACALVLVRSQNTLAPPAAGRFYSFAAFQRTRPLLFPEEPGNRNDKLSESAEEFERRVFGELRKTTDDNSFYRRLDKIEKGRGRSFMDGPRPSASGSQFMDGFSDSFDTLADGLDEKLNKASQKFAQTNEIYDEDYAFRPDVKFLPGNTYDLKDLDLTKPSFQRPFKRNEFETTTKEVLRKADFRNIRFLSNFLTEAGIIIKRSQTKISAKAQRKVAREIKTARALGLLPFTTMGKQPFMFGRSSQEFDEEYDVQDESAAAEN